jgi:tetratricopeptide (TPR) repeat protein
MRASVLRAGALSGSVALFTLIGCATSSTPASTTAQRIRAANELAGAGKFDQAIDGLRKILSENGRELTALRHLVEAYFKAGRLPEIRAEFDRRVAVNPSDDVAEYGIGLACYASAASATTDAITHFKRAASLRPDVAEYPFRAGVALLEAEHFEEAIPLFKKATDLDPTQARYLVPYAMALSRSGDRKGAIAAIARMTELEPEPKDVELAQRVMRRLTDPFRELPKGVEADCDRGINFLEQMDAPQDALVTFAEILEKYPDLAAVHALVGLCQHRLDNAGAAVEEYRRAIELAPDDARTYVYLGDVYFAHQRYDLARTAYEQAIDRDPLSTSAYARLAQIATTHNDAAEAAKRLKVLAKLLPKDPSVRLAYSEALLQQNDLGGAERELLSAESIDAKNVEVLQRLGMLFAQQAKVAADTKSKKELEQRATRYFERVLDQQPHNLLAAKMLKDLQT